MLRRIFLYNRNLVNLTSTRRPTLEIRFGCFATIKPNLSSKFVNFSRGRPINSLCLTVLDNILKFSGDYTSLINTSSSSLLCSLLGSEAGHLGKYHFDKARPGIHAFLPITVALLVLRPALQSAAGQGQGVCLLKPV